MTGKTFRYMKKCDMLQAITNIMTIRGIVSFKELPSNFSTLIGK